MRSCLAGEVFKSLFNIITHVLPSATVISSAQMDKEAKQGIRQELLKYCEQDTWAMVEIVKRYRK